MSAGLMPKFIHAENCGGACKQSLCKKDVLETLRRKLLLEEDEEVIFRSFGPGNFNGNGDRFHAVYLYLFEYVHRCCKVGDLFWDGKSVLEYKVGQRVHRAIGPVQSYPHKTVGTMKRGAFLIYPLYAVLLNFNMKF